MVTKIGTLKVSPRYFRVCKYVYSNEQIAIKCSGFTQIKNIGASKTIDKDMVITTRRRNYLRLLGKFSLSGCDRRSVKLVPWQRGHRIHNDKLHILFNHDLQKTST